MTPADLAARADAARATVLEAAIASGSCHIGSALSIVDILAVLYLDVMEAPGAPDGDRFLLSKGHGAAGLYAVLAETGVLDAEEVVAGYCSDGGRFHGHPERGAPGIEMTGGSLGHGLAIAIGLALACRHDGGHGRVFCLLGDGELNEGSVWEALALAGHLRLRDLCAVVDANGLQGLGRTDEVLRLGPLEERLRGFGWDVAEVDGHDHAALADAFRSPAWGPRLVVARTVKGYGVPFMEDDLMWHYRSLREADRERAFAALRRAAA